MATGKWGCGAYKGDPLLKFLVQWIAASEAERDMEFYSFDDKHLDKKIELFLEAFEGKTVGDLFTCLIEYIESELSKHKQNAPKPQEGDNNRPMRRNNKKKEKNPLYLDLMNML